MKVNFLNILLVVFYKYSQLYLGTNINAISIGILLFTVLNVAFVIVKKKLTKKQIKIFILLLGVSIITTIIAKDPNYILPFLLAFSLKDMEQKSILKQFLIVYIFFFILTILMGYMGILTTKRFTKYDPEQGIVERKTLGYLNPNTPFVFWFGIILALYSYKGKLNNKIILIGLSLFLYYETKCRTGLIVTILFIVTNKFVEKALKNKFLEKLVKYSFIILTIISIIIATRFGIEYDNSIDRLLSHRPWMWNLYLTQGIQPFGITLGDYPVDNWMLNILIDQGWIIYIIYAITFYKAFDILLKNKDYKMSVVLLFTLIYGMSEATINISDNIGVLYLFIIYFTKSKDVEEVKTEEIKRKGESYEILNY